MSNPILMKVRSTGGNEEVFDVDPMHINVNYGAKCPKGFQLRPHIVWFGEVVPENEVNVFNPNVTVIQKGASEGLQEFKKMLKIE